MKVLLNASSNPDHDSERRFLDLHPHFVEVDDFSEASKVCRTYIVDNDLGGGNWTGGKVLGDHDLEIAYVSYNGRVWDMNNKEIEL